MALQLRLARLQDNAFAEADRSLDPRATALMSESEVRRVNEALESYQNLTTAL
jgi:hypothetical protein